MNRGGCPACKAAGTPCAQHELGLDAAAILATVARETAPRIAESARPVPVDEPALTGLAGAWHRFLHPRGGAR